MKNIQNKFIKALELAKILQLSKGKFIRLCWMSDHSSRIKKTGEIAGKKVDNPFKNELIQKQYIAIVRNFFDYEKAVNSQLDKEGYQADYVAQPRTWGSHVDGTVFVEHEKQLYLHVLPVKYLTDAQTGYYINGRRIPEALLEPFIPKKKAPNNPLDKIRQSVHPVNCRLQDIISVKVDAVNYNLVLPSDNEIERLVNRVIKTT